MTKAIRVLYVDDETDLLDIGRIYLEESGELKVTTAMSAIEALRLLGEEKFDAIISDYQMPVMDGIQFLVEVRSRFGSIPFILFTGRGREEIVIQAINCGADFYLQKGGEPEAQFAELSHKVRQAASRKITKDLLQESEIRYRDLFENILEGFAFCRMLYDTEHQPVDFIYLNVNPAFDRITGTHTITGKPVTEVFPGIKEAFPELFEIYGRVALTGEPESFDLDFVLLKKWLHISVYSPKKEHFAAIFEDITERKQAEKVLAESEEKFRTAFYTSPDAIILTRLRDKMFISINKGFTEILGYTEEDTAGKTLLDLDVWADPADRDRLYEMLRANGKVEGLEATFRAKNGELRHGLMSATIIEFNGEKHLLNITRDITERKVAEEALKQSEERHRKILQTTNEGFWIIDLPEGNLTDVNDTYCKMSGYTRAELLKMHISDLDAIKTPDEQAATLKKIITKGSGIFETRHHRKDGSVFDVELSVAYQNMNGGKLICFCRDITERKVAEDAMRESKTLIDAVVENVPLMIFLKEATDLRFVVFNRAGEELLGYDRKALLGKNNLDLFPPEQAAHFMTKDREVLDGETGMLDIPEESILTAKKGQRLLHTRKVCIRGAGGTTKFLLGISEDITERKEHEQEKEFHTQELRKFSTSLELANKKLNLLSAITRHDITNQMSVLIGSLIILEKKQPDTSSSQYFKKINTSSQRISAMLRFTKEYEDIGVKAPVWQDSRTLVETAAKQVPLKKIMVKNNLSAGGEIFADLLIVKVFYNLMDNAARYGGKIMTIRFSVEERGCDHVVVCEDDGDGVEDEEREKIFGRGFGKNTGMGLFLSREILSITGITIRETGEPGKGARFEMMVPKGAWRTAGSGA